jgi:lysophospholipase L1-like esterase
MKNIIFLIIILLFSSNCFSEVLIINGSIVNAILNEKKQLLSLGDSISSGTYQNELQDILGIGEFDFIGSKKTNNYFFPYDIDHEGNPGYRTSQIESLLDNYLITYMTTEISTAENIVLLHIGTNDITSTIPTNEIVDNVEDIIDIINSFNSSISVYVALIIPRIGATHETYNTALNTMLENYQITKTNLYIVDMNSAFVNDTFNDCNSNWEENCMLDTLHPNILGQTTMAKQWAACMASPTATNCNGN